MDIKISKSELSEFLTTAGCCSYCVLRFSEPIFDEFLKVENFSENKLDEPIEKRPKLNPCVICFGIFEFVDEILAKVRDDESLKEFDVGKFFTSLFLPLSLNLAQLQMWLALLEKYPESFSEHKLPAVSVKDALKHILNEKLASELRKEFQVDGLLISIHFTHDAETEMLEKLSKAAPELMREWNSRKKSQKGGEVMSRQYFEKKFTPSQIDVAKFRELLPIPPQPTSRFRLEKIEFTGPTVFVAGRYNKFSRKLSQTPWMVGGKKLADESVEEIIRDVVLPYFKVNSGPSTTVTFMSSGREDVDVRCLGQGRPFALEIQNARVESLNSFALEEIEQKVRQSSSVSVRDVQMVSRDDLHHIKTGEENKKKFYRALCVLRGENVSEKILEKLQIENPFEIQQWTPFRVLHRRTLLKRPRTIFSVKAFAIKEKPNLIALDIVTQAGTYVKELVHGEFGRTEPSIASIIGKDIDITSLDVMNIDLDFPPKKVSLTKL